MTEAFTGLGLDSPAETAAYANGEPVVEDAVLIESLRQGAETAYEQLVARYQQPVYNLAFRLVEDPSDTADVVQEVFLKVFRHIGSFRGQSSLKTWIYRIAVNEAHNHRRWFSRHRKLEVDIEPDEDAGRSGYCNTLPDPAKSPYEIALGFETRTLIEEALGRLKPVFRHAVVLRDVEDLSYEEIAEVLNISIGTVKSRILRGREALRKELLERLEQAKAIGWPARAAQQDQTVA
ncbi:MAG: sigma-70 family RNA polymerase sigma factor [Bryobacteraceae bacterium]|nr:sigma-70 family RNA polymerase sigma factor [Bryobacteraceae bacterium]